MLVAGFQYINAQDDNRRTITNTAEQKKDGYSIVLTNTKVAVSITEEDLKVIDQKRSVTDTVIYNVSPYAYIKIYPKTAIKE